MDDRINASLQIEKVNDSGSKVLTYWDRDENGDPPSGYYFTVSGNAVTFWGDAIIGAEDVDDAQDFYRFSYVSDGVQDNIHTVSIPPLAEVYNMNGEEGPHSMRIQVGGDTVRPDQLLAARPSAEDIETTHGVYVDQSTGRIEFYGDLRPAYNQEISIRYREDDDGRNDVYTFTLPNGTGIDTYNLENEPDLELNRSLRVFTRTGSGVEQELLYDGENGYTYNPSNGQISLHGNARPDLPSGTTIRVEYMRDLSGSQTTTEVYGIPLDWRYPEVYNIETDEEPKSIRVYRNGEEISFSETEGFFYNEETNTIELNGMARPDTGDLYSIHMIRELGGVSWRNGVVEVGLSTPPETYGIADPDIPSTFRVVVDGREVHYDPFQLDGFYYNSDTNRIELYGESRPDAGHASDPDVQVYYVYESSAATRGNDTYDFRLNSSSLSYGVGTDEEPQAIRVYLSGVEIPYSEEHGYTYNTDTNILSLHGDFRPDGGNDRGDYRVYSVSSNSITIPVPTNSYVYEVHVNGQEIPETDSIDGNGYYFDGRMVQLVGDARPNITNTTGSVRMNVSYYDSLDIHLNNSPSMPDYLSSCGCGEDAHLLFSEIDPTELSVYFNGTTLTDEQFSLQGNRIVLDKDKVDVQLGANTIEVDYRLRYVVGYEANDFTFQVGANAGQNYLVEIQSFDNMLMDTNQICVLTHEEASASINLVDKALSFVNAERSHVGAVSNRLNSMASNLSVLEENTTAAVSRIEDADMAKEAMNLMRANVLSQAQTAMHAQMNQSSHRVLELLR
ncbi:flagellin protein FlaB [Halalkalibacter wakoensis JCM 9140]|uniref:Flagellin protein FlaB n=2 Tax=Halalkalibacter wakoensis TaxID=127891 RepID=W4Q3L9_9BACI|nr:flagellin protein FlaB [Halalkalibacter wakoensis JCM 9140]